MGRQCTACNHPELSRIDQALRSGEPHRKVADRYGLSPSATWRHLDRHVREPRPEIKVRRPSTPKPRANGNPARELKYERIAFGYAKGEPVTEIAKRFGYSYNYCWKLLHTSHMQTRVNRHLKDLTQADQIARDKILRNALELVEDSLDIALGRDTKVNGDGEEFEEYRYPVQLRMKAASHLLDKVLPKAGRTEIGPTRSTGPEADDLQRILDRIEEEARNPRPRLDFDNSPFIHSGEEAIPRAIEVGPGRER